MAEAMATAHADRRRQARDWRGAPPPGDRSPLAEDVLAGLPVQPKPKITIERILLILGFLGAFMQFVFGLGVNWHGTLATSEQVTQLKTELGAQYVRKDVYDAQQAALRDVLKRLNDTLDEFNREQRAAAARQRERGN